MSLYILDSLYRRIELVETYESLIWTERVATSGDFELVVSFTRENSHRFSMKTKLSISESKRVMVIQTVETRVDEEGKAVLKLKGRSLEYILGSRLARGTLGDLITTPKWVLEGTPKSIAERLFHDICVEGVVDSGDIIAGVNEVSIFPADTISAPTETVVYELDPMSLYQAISDICDIYDMGFRLVCDPNTFQLHFDVYMGSDRTSQQTALPAVIFAPNLDNLSNTEHLSTITLYKNVAYVLSPVGHQVVYATDVDPSVAGFERHALFVVADDITDEDGDVSTARMIQRGKEQLARSRELYAFDGEVSRDCRYIYGRDYNLSDLVEIHDGDGGGSVMRVTEWIYVSDKEGTRSYPTLSRKSILAPGSWDSVSPDTSWDEVDPELSWDEW